MSLKHDKPTLHSFHGFMGVLAPNVIPGSPQWQTMQQCFFAGASWFLQHMMTHLDDDAEPTEADLAMIERIANELQAYAESQATEAGVILKTPSGGPRH